MNSNQSLNKKIISGIIGFVVFIVACYFVYNFIQSKNEATLIANKDSSSLLRPEIIALLDNLKKEVAFLRDRDVMNNNFVKNDLETHTEVIDPLYPPRRDNPFAQ